MIRAALALGAVVVLLMMMSVGGMSWQNYDQAAQATPLCATKPGAPVVKGKYTQGQIEALWVAQGGPENQAAIAGAVGMAESGGDPNAYNPSGATGLMQILGAVLPGDLRDPAVNMRNAIKKWRDAHGWSPWEAYTNGRYLRWMGKAGSFGGASPEPVDCPDTGIPGRVVVAPGANLPGRPIAPETLAYLAQVAGIYGHAIICTTGTNHNQFTVDGNVSDHYDGHACDIGMVANHGTNDGPVGDAIATACLTAAGDSPALITLEVGIGGLWTRMHNGLRIQCIWKTDAGGNHHDHVHVGARSAT